MTQAFNLSQFANNVNSSGLASLTTGVTGTLPIANGGTGSTTASLVAGTGISITGSFPNQTVAQSSSGQGGRGQAFTSSGTFTIPTGITSLKVTVVGAGGGGGGPVSYGALGGGGGGAGGGGISYLTSLTSGNTIAVTIGAGGAGGANSDGSAGGFSRIASGTQSITTVTANGGAGGGSSTSPIGIPGGVGGTTSGATLNITGGAGGGGISDSNFTNAYGGGVGGSSLFGGGGKAAANNGNSFTNGSSGGGGGGGCYASPSPYAGSGGSGVVIFEW